MKSCLRFAIITVLIAVCSVFLFGCKEQAGEKPITVTKTAAEIFADVKAVSGFGNMTAVPTRDYMDIYGIANNNVEDAAWYMSENPSLNGDEVAIFKAVDEQFAKELVSVFESRIERQKQVAESYSPEELAKYQKTQVTRVGNWVYYVVGDNYTQMMNVLRDTIGG